jgi:hypothetical protein
MMTEPLFDETEDSPLFSLIAKVGLTIDRLTERIARQDRREQQRLDSLPRINTFSTIIGNTAGTTAYYDFGSPPPGRVWEGRNIGVFGAGGTGVVAWYVGVNLQVAPGLSVPTNVRLATANPALFFDQLSTGQITVLPNEHLIVAGTGLAPNVSLAVIATVADMPQWAQYGVAAVG